MIDKYNFGSYKNQEKQRVPELMPTEILTDTFNKLKLLNKNRLKRLMELLLTSANLLQSIQIIYKIYLVFMLLLKTGHLMK